MMSIVLWVAAIWLAFYTGIAQLVMLWVLWLTA